MTLEKFTTKTIATLALTGIAMLSLAGQAAAAELIYETTFPEHTYPEMTPNGWGGIDGWVTNDSFSGAQGAASNSVYLGYFSTTASGTIVYRDFIRSADTGLDTVRFTIGLEIKKSSIEVISYEAETGEPIITIPAVPEFTYNINFIDSSNPQASNSLFISSLTGDIRSQDAHGGLVSVGAVAYFDDVFTLTVDINYTTGRWSAAVEDVLLFSDSQFIRNGVVATGINVDQLGFQFNSATLVAPDTYMIVDYISISSIPEPSTISCLMGFIIMIRISFRRVSNRKYDACA